MPVWTPLDVFTWVAFGERRSGADYLFPLAILSDTWGHWPPQNLDEAFYEIASGVTWQPVAGSLEQGSADADRSWARKVMERRGVSALELGWMLEADIERFRQSEARYANAKAEVMAAIRDGRLPVWARKAHGSARPNHDAPPELLDRRLFTHDEAREVNEGAWVDGAKDYKGPWWDQVRFDADKVQAIWPASQTASGIASHPSPFPAGDNITPWPCVCWRAFGTVNAPPHIAHHRSFDGGDTRFPDESEARYSARQADHQCFDAAERKLMDLLASGHVIAKGQSPARAKSGRQLHHPAPAHVAISGDIFLNRELAFAPNGELIPHLNTPARLFAPLELRGSEADPDFPHFYDVLIDAVGLRNAWRITPAIQAETPCPSPPQPQQKRRVVQYRGYTEADAPLVQKALAGIKSGAYKNPTDAARALAKDAKGSRNEDSRMKRLLGRIQKCSVSE